MWCDFSLRLTEKWGGKKQIFSDYYIKRTWGGGQRYEGWVWQDRHISLNRVDLKRDFITVLLLSSCLHLIKTPWVPCACALLSCVLDLLDRSLQAVSLSTHHRELALAEGPKNYQNPPKTHTQLWTNSDGINTLPNAPLENITCRTALTMAWFMACAMISWPSLSVLQRANHFSVLSPQPDEDVEK